MKTKFLVLGTVTLFLLSCAGSMQVRKEQSTFYQDHSFDEVWNASIKAIRDIGFTIKNMEKESGFIYAEGGRNVWTQNEPPQLNVTITQSNGKVHVDCQAVQPGQIIDYGASKKNVGKFMESLNKNLNKL